SEQLVPISSVRSAITSDHASSRNRGVSWSPHRRPLHATYVEVEEPSTASKPTMGDADDLPPKRPECLSRLAPRRDYLAGISSVQRRSTEPTQHGQRSSQM